jgi:hypothetical protein
MSPTACSQTHHQSGQDEQDAEVEGKVDGLPHGRFHWANRVRLFEVGEEEAPDVEHDEDGCHQESGVD